MLHCIDKVVIDDYISPHETRFIEKKVTFSTILSFYTVLHWTYSQTRLAIAVIFTIFSEIGDRDIFIFTLRMINFR